MLFMYMLFFKYKKSTYIKVLISYKCYCFLYSPLLTHMEGRLYRVKVDGTDGLQLLLLFSCQRCNDIDLRNMITMLFVFHFFS